MFNLDVLSFYIEFVLASPLFTAVFRSAQFKYSWYAAVSQRDLAVSDPQ